MKIRSKDDHEEIGWATERSPHNVEDIIVNFPLWAGYDCRDNYEFYIEALKEWVNSERAFDRKERLTIVNKYNTSFLEPKTPEDKARGYEL